MRTYAVVLLGAGLLAGCTTSSDTHADISKIAGVKASFGPEYKVNVVPVTGIDPARIGSGQKLPDGMVFDPPACAKLSENPSAPADLNGNMSSVIAEGGGVRYIVIATETSQPLPSNDPGPDCQKVNFAGNGVRGTVQVVDAPQIDNATTLGKHVVMQITNNGKPQTGETYTYTADFGDYRVLVTANPTVVPDKPTVPVDTERAKGLLTAGVAAITG
ncbi:hypothetical protein MINS_39550 [Mycolicibacterium insubricum]|uniref:Uncharacterized protein n=1 Tax=Mycolicibacterium insubricum TaxID=444597 RepID=A0A1X0DMP9_9MYCO|nr:DUF5642 family protein [Mycolicibacterium insubricum]MCV7081009.1 DUF5642 family protein [Mycolicibacterium insubricum]ORA73120.1 hypothetical protein BST26_03570 [Mycolicibacterium insubricum]BBZ68526.1 hypothetical protein MINS_39550 [Mycolicibacterium insubricum]